MAKLSERIQRQIDSGAGVPLAWFRDAALLESGRDELLAACETIRAHLNDFGPGGWARELVRTVLDPAIAKATT